MKGGGHTANPGFSSTEGVHITMTRFNDVVYNANSGTADIGAGLAGDAVYEALEPYNVSILGGRVRDVGIAGFTLGGGTYIIQPSFKFDLFSKEFPCIASNCRIFVEDKPTWVGC